LACGSDIEVYFNKGCGHTPRKEVSWSEVNDHLLLTPELCRARCKDYDGVKDVNDGVFKEFCLKQKGSKILDGDVCRHYESEESNPAGILSW
jgi:hypothetical protein